MPLATDLEALACDIAREAGELARSRRREGVAIAATKSHLADIVTEADREVEQLIRRRLGAERPGDGFLGEESGGERGSTDITWVVDPIDGTVNYAYGIPSYAVSIAAVAGDPDPAEWERLAAAVFNPASGELFHAARDGGAWLDGERLTVNAEAAPAGALVATGFGYRPETHAGDLARLARVIPIARDVRRIGAASLDLAFVAAGRLDAYFERGLQPWDHAAGGLLVTEAGGMLGVLPADDHGRALIIAAGPVLFEKIRTLAAD
ncbi:inositol monophosphatase family protein [Microbacterium sp. BK668]|uniref:inositol monophosphatase family protein n=1 Tax=Microbacterium sp. BK668 TaxID=2512118 RepID=UPI00105F1BB2|nr:inositol monophosphatase family protein [Microbacterium sp. BK668]TDN91921.1 myo-inositol-1(or 4)-monophosphatase [Microbacterium sp. BK668]